MEKNLTEILLEIHGQSYVDLLNNDRKKHQDHIRDMCIACIADIMSNRLSMGIEPSVKLFDSLYDKDLYELQLLQIEYRDLAYLYNKKNNLNL